jgi:hypothetical protein
MDAEVGIFRRIGGNPELVAIVIPKDDVYGMEIAAAELVNDERGAEIPAAKHHLRIFAYEGEGGIEFPDVVVDIGQDCDSQTQAPLRIFAANFSRNLRTLGETTKEQ